ncbi:uncharacterized protein LOC108667899 isoform X2 [Hyalella azteca]|uniref:Uncharacterized protein LOC108667899 isoform X2 n=1 Tax=Hyalella azteca TaxID=294128 RepID=A0A979FRR2_HYAAZ|nr:uncharacterized protein LOC108667899 isoform X2 [Hyalella azteca]
MSFIHFLGKPILPPVEKREDEWLLSLSCAAAVDVLLNDPTYPSQRSCKYTCQQARHAPELPTISSRVKNFSFKKYDTRWLSRPQVTISSPESEFTEKKCHKSSISAYNRCKSGLMLSPHHLNVNQHQPADASQYQQQHPAKYQLQEEQPKLLLQQRQKEQLRLQQLQEQRLRARGYSNSFQLAMSRSCGEDELSSVRRQSLPHSVNSLSSTVMRSSDCTDSVQPIMEPATEDIPAPSSAPSQHVLDDYLLQLTGQALPPPPSRAQFMSQSWSPSVRNTSSKNDNEDHVSHDRQDHSCQTKIDVPEDNCECCPAVTVEDEVNDLNDMSPGNVLDSPAGEELPKWLMEAKSRRSKGDANGRSVGSNYLDSYLGNLTQSSWVNYAPSTPAQPTVYAPKRVYIYPEVFYKREPLQGEPLFMSRSFTEGVTNLKRREVQIKDIRDVETSSPCSATDIQDTTSEGRPSDSPIDATGHSSVIGTMDDVSYSPSFGTESGMGTDIATKALSSQSTLSINRLSDAAPAVAETEQSFTVDSLETDVPCRTDTSGVITHGTPGSGMPTSGLDEEEVTISENFPDIPFENECNEENVSNLVAINNTISETRSDIVRGQVDPAVNFVIGGPVSVRDDQSCTSNASDESSCCTQPSTIVMIRSEADLTRTTSQVTKTNMDQVPAHETLNSSLPLSTTCKQFLVNPNKKEYSSLEDNLVNNNTIFNNMKNLKSETSYAAKELIQDSLDSSLGSLSSLRKLSIDSNCNAATIATDDYEAEADENVPETEDGDGALIIPHGRSVSFDLPHCTSAASTPDMSLVSAASVCGTSASLADDTADSEMTASDMCRDDLIIEEGEAEEASADNDVENEVESAAHITKIEKSEFHDVDSSRSDVVDRVHQLGNEQVEEKVAEYGASEPLNDSKCNASPLSDNGSEENHATLTENSSKLSPESAADSVKSDNQENNLASQDSYSVLENPSPEDGSSVNRDCHTSEVEVDLLSSTTSTNRPSTAPPQRPVAVTAPQPIATTTANKPSVETTSFLSGTSHKTPSSGVADDVQAISPAGGQFCPPSCNSSSSFPATAQPVHSTSNSSSSKPNTPSSPARGSGSFSATTPTTGGACFYPQQGSRVTTPMSSPHRHSTPTTPSGSFYSPVTGNGPPGVLGKCSSRQHQINALLQLLRVQHHHEREQLVAKQHEEMQQFMQHLQKLTPAQLQHIVSAQVSSVQGSRVSTRSSEVEGSKSPNIVDSVAPTALQVSPPNNESSSPCEDSYASSSVTASQSTPSDSYKNLASKSPTSFYLHNPAHAVNATTPGHLNKLFLQFPSKKIPSPPQKAASPLCSAPSTARPAAPSVSRSVTADDVEGLPLPTNDPSGLSTSQSKLVKQVMNEKQAAHSKKSSPTVIKEKMLNAPPITSATSKLAPITPHEDMAELSASLTNSDLFNSLHSSLISETGVHASSLPRSATVTKLTIETFLPTQRSDFRDSTVDGREAPAAIGRRRSVSSAVRGVTLLQAVVRGRHVRRLLRCGAVQQHIATLEEVNKLAAQFHRDILADNINKGDIDFHRALYQQEQVARSELRRIFLTSSFMDQVELIQRDLHQTRRQRHLQTKVPRLPRPRSTVKQSRSVHRPTSASRSSAGESASTARSCSQPSPRTIPAPRKYPQQNIDHSLENHSSMTTSYYGGYGSHNGTNNGSQGGGGRSSTTATIPTTTTTKNGAKTTLKAQYRHVQSRYLGSVTKSSIQNPNVNADRHTRYPGSPSGVSRRVALPNCAASASFSSPQPKPHHNEKMCQQQRACAATAAGNGCVNNSGLRRGVTTSNGAAPHPVTAYDRRHNRKLWR